MRKAKIKSYSEGRYQFKEEVIAHHIGEKGVFVEKSDGHTAWVDAGHIQFLPAEKEYSFDGGDLCDFVYGITKQ